MFAYEGQKEIVRIGYLRRIKERGRTVLVEYEFDEDIAPFTFDRIAHLRMQLDIADWEMNRTHWAIKEEALFEILATAGVVDSSLVSGGSLRPYWILLDGDALASTKSSTFWLRTLI